jgi:hypothetical protein
MACRFWKSIARCCPSPDESVPEERSKRKFFARHARSSSPLDSATCETRPKPVLEGEGKKSVNVDNVSSGSPLAYSESHLNATPVSAVP